MIGFNLSRKDSPKSLNLISSYLILGIHSKAFISKLFYKQSFMNWVIDQAKIEINDKNKITLFITSYFIVAFAAYNVFWGVFIKVCQLVVSLK